jgi:limonene-1,2-epoxide hydrolase
MTEVVTQLTAAMNAHDLDAMASLIAEDYRSEQPLHPGREFVGRAQMRANWAAMLAGIPDFHAELLRSTQDGATTWSEWRWTGRRAEGQPIDVRGVTLFEVRDGQIVAGRLYMEDVDQGTSDIGDAVEARAGRRPE